MHVVILILIFMALASANLPWVSDRFLLIFTPPNEHKREWMRWVEWILLYAIVGLVAVGLEHYAMGERHTQGWEFTVVTVSLFLVAAMPGFVYRHMLSIQFKKISK